MDEKDLKIQALLETVMRLTNENADLRVELTRLAQSLSQTSGNGVEEEEV